jgi:hypothetical protein
MLDSWKYRLTAWRSFITIKKEFTTRYWYLRATYLTHKMYSVYQPGSTCEIDEYILHLECCYNACFLVACMNGFFLNNSIVLVANVCGDGLQLKKLYNFVYTSWREIKRFWERCKWKRERSLRIIGTISVRCLLPVLIIFTKHKSETK